MTQYSLQLSLCCLVKVVSTDVSEEQGKHSMMACLPECSTVDYYQTANDYRVAKKLLESYALDDFYAINSLDAAFILNLNSADAKIFKVS